MNRPAIIGSNSSDGIDSLPTDYQDKDLSVIYSTLLLKTPADETRLVWRRRTIKSRFQFKDLSRCYQAFTRG